MALLLWPASYPPKPGASVKPSRSTPTIVAARPGPGRGTNPLTDESAIALRAAQAMQRADSIADLVPGGLKGDTHASVYVPLYHRTPLAGIARQTLTQQADTLLGIPPRTEKVRPSGREDFIKRADGILVHTPKHAEPRGAVARKRTTTLDPARIAQWEDDNKRRLGAIREAQAIKRADALARNTWTNS